MEPLALWYQVVLGFINVVTACGLGACITLVWLMSKPQAALAPVRIIVLTTGLTLLILLFSVLAIPDPHPEEFLTLFRRIPGRLLLSGGMLWFLYTLIREDRHRG